MPQVLIWDYTMAERMNMKEMMSDTTISSMREMVKDYLSEMRLYIDFSTFFGIILLHIGYNSTIIRNHE